jgi:peptidoglycan/LPS O-acetylase OafA/YrhL
LIWSRNKTVEEMKNGYTHAPVWLGAISCGFYFLLAILNIFFVVFFVKDTVNTGLTASVLLIEIAFIVAMVSAMIGYACIGMSLLGYMLLQKINFIQD